jgi:apolipoprotein N-acyltransferase
MTDSPFSDLRFRDFARRFWPQFAAITSGLLLAGCYPPFTQGDLIWIWSIPLWTALWFSTPPTGWPRWRWGLLLGYLAGVTFFLTSLCWLNEISNVVGSFWSGFLSWLVLSLYLGCYFGVFGAFAATVGRWIPGDKKGDGKVKANLFGQSLGVLRVAFLNGAAWCGLEWLRSVLLTGFGWNGLGVALRDHLLLVQGAEIIGITGYSFVVTAANVILFATLVRIGRVLRNRQRLRPHLDFAVGVAMIIGLILYGLPGTLAKPEQSIELRARILQLNIPMEDKWSDDLDLRRQILDDYRDLTRTFVETAPHDLVLWPETALPGLFHFPWVQEYLNDQVLKGDDFYLLTGLEDSNLEQSELYNTITLMRGSTEDYQMYKKIHLVPLGEFIPLREVLPVFEWIAGKVIEFDFTPGNSVEPLEIEIRGAKVGIIPLICYEDTVSRLARKFIRSGPQVMVNVTNDGWFRESAESAQHFDNARFRCIELRRPLIRAANTGVSGFIDERGSIHSPEEGAAFPRIIRDEESGSTFIRGSLPATMQVDIDPPITIYAKFGDWFAVLLGAMALGETILHAGPSWYLRFVSVRKTLLARIRLQISTKKPADGNS